MQAIVPINRPAVTPKDAKRAVMTIDAILADAQADPAVRVRVTVRAKRLAATLTRASATMTPGELRSLAYALAAMDAALRGDDEDMKAWFHRARTSAAADRHHLAAL